MKDINLLNVWFVIVIVVFFAELINGPPASLTGPPGSARVLFGLPNSSARRASCSSGAQGHMWKHTHTGRFCLCRCLYPAGPKAAIRKAYQELVSLVARLYDPEFA